jgi:hypothetical protein
MDWLEKPSNVPSVPVSSEAAAAIGIAGTLIGAAGKWALDQLDYRAKRGDRVRERTYPDRVKAYVDLVWAVDAVVTKPQSQRQALLDQYETHKQGIGELPKELRGAFMTRDRVMLISSDDVRRAATDFCELVVQPQATDEVRRREDFRTAATGEFERG